MNQKQDNTRAQQILSIIVAVISAIMSLTALRANQIGTQANALTEKKIGLVKQIQKLQMQEALSEGRQRVLQVFSNDRKNTANITHLVQSQQALEKELQVVKTQMNAIQNPKQPSSPNNLFYYTETIKKLDLISIKLKKALLLLQMSLTWGAIGLITKKEKSQWFFLFLSLLFGSFGLGYVTFTLTI